MLECDLKVKSIQIMQNLEKADRSFSHPLEPLLMLLLFSFLRSRFLNWFSPNPSQQGTKSCRLQPPPRSPLLEPTGELLFFVTTPLIAVFFFGNEIEINPTPSSFAKF
jgi:hypothetical protein